MSKGSQTKCKSKKVCLWHYTACVCNFDLPRYIPEKFHKEVAPEFMKELATKGRIYGYRFRPQGVIKARPVDEYTGTPSPHCPNPNPR